MKNIKIKMCLFLLSKYLFVFCHCRYMARSFTFILPYFPTGTMERVDTEGQVATAKVLVNNNNNNNSRISIPPSVVTSEAVAEPVRSRESAIVG